MTTGEKSRKNGDKVLNSLKNLIIEVVGIEKIKPYSRNARTHSPGQVQQLAQSLEVFGWTNPLLVSEDLDLIAGHGRLEAAKFLNLPEVPVRVLNGFTEAERRAYVIADNKLAEAAGWDLDLLGEELEELSAEGIDLDLTGFSEEELDSLLDFEDAEELPEEDQEEEEPGESSADIISRPGELFVLGAHRLTIGEQDLEEADSIIKKWQALTGQDALNARTGLKFGA